MFDFLRKRREWNADNSLAGNGDDSRWGDEPEPKSISERIMRLNRYLLYRALPILSVVFIICLISFLFNKEEMRILSEQGYRDDIVTSLAYFVVPIVLALFLYGISYVLELEGNPSLVEIISWPFAFFGFLKFIPFVVISTHVESLNRTKLEPAYSVRTVIIDVKHGRYTSCYFKGGNEMEWETDSVPVIKYDYKPERVRYRVVYGELNVGDSIRLIYGVGTLGILDIMKWERIDTTQSIWKDWTRKDKDGNWGVDLRKKKTEYGPAVERSLGEYLKGYMPNLNRDYSGWVNASFTIDADGNVCNVHASGNRSMHRALTEMGKWIGLHHKGQKEKVEIKFCYCCGNPYYMISERVISTDKGPKLKIRDEFDLSGAHGYAFWSVHEETKL